MLVLQVKIGNHIMGDVLEMSEIYNLALSTQNISYQKGDHIMREGEKGDNLFIIKSGFVDVYVKSCGDTPIGTICAGKFNIYRYLSLTPLRKKILSSLHSPNRLPLEIKANL